MTPLLGAWTTGGGADPARNRLMRLVAGTRGRKRSGGRILARIDRRLVRTRILAALERHLLQAGIPLTVSEALCALAAGSALLAVGAGAFRGAGVAVVVAGTCPVLAWRALAAARDRRLRRLDGQLPAALDFLVGQLRAHRSVAEAIMEIAERIRDPLRGEFSRIAEEARLGAPLSQALEAFRRRVPSQAVSMVVTAIQVADRTGGNLPEFLSRQAATVRDHVAFLQEVRALTAHARSTAAILTVLPVAVALAMYALSPHFFGPMLASGPGRTLLASAAAMEVIGWHVIRSMVRSVER